MSTSSYRGPRATSRTGSASRSAAQESKGNGSSSSSNDSKSNQTSSRQPDITKYAKYLQDNGSSKFDEAQYKPIIRAERHQMGYTAALNQRRNRANGDPANLLAEELNQRRHASNRIHGRSYSLNRASTYSDSNRASDFQKNSDASAGPRERNRIRVGDGISGSKLKVPTVDVLEEEQTSNPPKSNFNPDAYIRNKTSSTTNSETKKSSSASYPSSYREGTSSRTSKVFSAKQEDGTSTRTLRSGKTIPNEDDTGSRTLRSGKTIPNEDDTSSRTLRSGKTIPNEDSSTRTRPGSRSKLGENSGIRNTDKKTSKGASTTQEPNKKFFVTVEDLDEEVPLTDLKDKNTRNLSDSRVPSETNHENLKPKKTFLSPESCYSSKYFPSPFESMCANDNSSRPDSSSCRESSIKSDNTEENETQFKYSPRHSSRGSVFEHIRSQDSRRSHSLDSRSRTPTREGLSHSPSPSSQGRNSRRSRFDQMESLNESKFESKELFKEHLLNLTMNKDEYEDIMCDFKNGSLIEDLDTVGLDGQPEVESEMTEKQSDTTSAGSDPNCGNKSQNVPNISVNIMGEHKDASSKDFNAQSVSQETATDVPETATKEQATPVVNGSSNTSASNESVFQENLNNDGNNSAKESSKEYFRLLGEMIESVRTKYSSSDMPKSEDTPVTLEPMLSEDISHKWRFQKTEFGIPTSIGITSDGCVIVADYGNSYLEFFNGMGDFEHKIEGVKPFGIAVNKKDQVIVGDRRGKAIRIFDKYGADVAHWESKTFGWISGIALLQNGNLAICDRDRCKVGIFTECGELVTEFGSYGTNNSQICMADFLAVDSKDRIIVADSGNHCLKLFDTTGKAIGKISSRGVDSGLLEWPKGICVDKRDNIIVADMHNSRVSMFSTTGEFVQQLLSMTPNPYNVCYGQDSGLLGTVHYSLKGFSQYDIYAF